MIIKQKKKRNIFLFLNVFMFFRRAKRRGYIDGEDLPDEKNRKGSSKSLWIAVVTFFAVILASNYLINLFFEVVTTDFEFDFFSEAQTEFSWFRWYWLVRIRSLEFFLMTAFLALVLSFVAYKRFGRRIERLNYGQKGDHRFATLKEIKAQYVEIPDKKEEFAGMGGVPVSHHGNKYYIDLDTVNSLFLGTSRSGKGEGHVIPLIDILSRAIMEKCAMVVNDPKGELFAAAKEILEERGYEVQVLNILDPMQGMSYNPLQLIIESWRNGDRPTAQKLVSTFAHAVFYEAQAGQNKWVYEGAEKLFSAVVLALIDECGKNNTLEKVTIYNVGQMIIELSAKKFVNPTTGDEKDGLDKYFEKLPRGNVAKARYASALSAGKKTKGSILSIVFDKLDIFQSESIAKMTSANSFDLKSVGFQGSITMKFEPKLFNRRFKVNFIRDGQILDSSTVRPNLTGIANLNFKTEIQTGDKLEVVTSGLEKKRVVYKIERVANHVLRRLSYLKIIKLHKESDTLGLLEQIDMTYSDKPLAVFMITPDYDTSQNVLASTFVKQLYTTLAQNASQTKGKKCFRRVQFILDEAGNMPALEGLDNMLTVCLGRNIIFNLFLQSYSQLDSLYNKDIAKIVKENCQNHIYIASGDPDTHEEISKRVSTKTVESISISEKVLDMETSQTRQATEERVISTGRISTILEGETIVLRPLKRRDLKGNKIRPFPLFNTKETAMPYRHEFLADDFDTNKDINDFDIPSRHTHLCLIENAVDVDVMLANEPEVKAKMKQAPLKVTEKSVRKWLKDETTLTKEQIEKVMKYKKTG